MEWISVKDRLPDEGQFVIMYFARQNGYNIGDYKLANTWQGKKLKFVPFNSWWDDAVTHWMPLPEPPKE